MAGHLTPEERDRIAQLWHRGTEQRDIAEALGRSPSTISRELRRNGTGGDYFAAQAQRESQRRRRERPLERKMENPQINKLVHEGLAQEWSPEQISGRMKQQHPDKRERAVSPQTIYAWIRQDSQREHWESLLRRRGKRPWRRQNPAASQAARISGRITATEAAASAGLAARALGLAQGDDFVGDETLADLTIEIVDGGGNVVVSTETDDDGLFTADVGPGTYTVNLLVGEESVLSFTLDVPEGGTLFAEGKVDLLPNGKLKLDLQIFRDDDGDGEPDDTFRIRIQGRIEGEPASGDTDVEASQDDIEDQVTICHIPPGNPDNAHTIVVGAPAVDAHLAHGDFEGECDGDDGASDDDLDNDGVHELLCLTGVFPAMPYDRARLSELWHSSLEPLDFLQSSKARLTRDD